MPGAAYPVFWYNLKGIAQLHHDSKVVWLADYANFPDRNGGISSILTKPPYLLICRGTCTLWQFIWRTWSELCLLENEIVNYYYGSTKPWPKVQLPEVTQDLKQLQNTMALKVEESETSLEEPASEQSLKWLVKTFYGLVCVWRRCTSRISVAVDSFCQKVELLLKVSQPSPKIKAVGQHSCFN